MNAICFACGREKQDPLDHCDHCDVKPMSQKDRISSYCLSSNCLKPASLEKGSKYIRLKRKLPKIAEPVIRRATKIVESLDVDEEQYTSMGMDESFFDFKGFADKRAETVRVHSIGKPPKSNDGDTTGVSHMGSQKNTYRLLTWELGKDISIDDCDANVDENGELYIQFVWMGDRGWIWKHVSKSHFDQLRALDQFRE